MSSIPTHPPSVIVHSNVFIPEERLDTVEAGLEGKSTVEVPAVTVQAPVPAEGVLAESVAVDAEQSV